MIDKQALAGCWRMFHREHNVSVDRVACDPELRAEFVSTAASVCGSDDEKEILWTLMRLRKSKSLTQQSVSQPQVSDREQA